MMTTHERPTILVVEDETPLQNAIEIKLTGEGYRVLIAGSAQEAEHHLSTEQPDLIWLDLLLPGMDGMEFLEKMRSHEEWKQIPVIVVSVTMSQDKINRAFELNVVDYIVKSQYRIEDIITKINDFFAEKKSSA